jgi:hypothetical protein
MDAAQARRIGSRPLRPDPPSGTRPAGEIGSRLDDAIALFRTVMPGFGIKLVVPPPLPDGSLGRVSLSAWRRGAESARVHAGTSARETLQQLIDCEVQTARERRDRALCPLCRGLGWYIAASGIKAICIHPKKGD